MSGGKGPDISPRAGDMATIRPNGLTFAARVMRGATGATSVAAKTSGIAAGTASGDGAGRADRGLGAATSARRP